MMLSPLAGGGGRAGSRSGAREDAQDGARDGVFLVEIERFQGPMDLLLHLIRQQDLDIFDIPIARITDQFLAAVKGIQASDLDSAGEFLEMAATLIRIKAQLLLPRPESDEDEDPRAELVRRLLEYEQVREITHHMENAEAERSRRFSKGFVAPRPRAPVEETPLETTWDEVFQAALEVTLPDLASRDHRVTPRTVSMDEKVLLILSRLREGGLGPGEGERRVEFRALVAPFQERMHGVMTFLAGLELSRRRRIHLRQSAPFHDLWLYWREREPGDEAEDPLNDTLGDTLGGRGE
jgi:segregation and condensation protein A